MELSDLKGVGAARLKALGEAGVSTLSGLLLTLPSSYRDTTTSTPLREVSPGGVFCVEGALKAPPKLSRFRGMTAVTARLCDESGSLPLVWYNQPWMEKQLPTEGLIVLYGRIERDKRGVVRMNCPSVVTERALLPVYRRLGAIPAKSLMEIMRQALTEIDACCPETLPRALRMKYGLCERNFAIRQAHFPESREHLLLALRRVAFEQALFYQTATLLLRGERARGVSVAVPSGAVEAFWRTLPFSPTGAQRRVLDEIVGDLACDRAMARIVQGDVGSGKTAVAFGAMTIAARAGFQCAMMAPTEILARQHMKSAQKLLETQGISCGLLLGGMKVKERREALQKIASGEWQVVIGTHALLSEPVQYGNLGLVVTDEQHRFGVRQRKVLSDKAETTPNVLVMSATPIPRTLALILYGDLDLSIIDEMPPGRTPVTTRIVPESKREAMYEFIIREAKNGGQSYIVCPLVEENDALDAKSARDSYAELCTGALKSLRVGLTYGSQPPEEKQQTLDAFSRGETDVLVATTVVEVGVDVPNASVMVIENADRFGLSQLHQLRGRVGRGKRESWCFLMGEPNERLRALCMTNDGFAIAQKDLELRGPGDLMGTRQHGESGIPGMPGIADARLIEETSACLKELQSPGNADDWAIVRENARAAFDAALRQIAMN